ncbi:MAG TPA: class III signal peptide-containing protein [Methanobacterium sp.]|nr:class III signal peptide-containing protein [Methanobacterium sp.]
MGIIEEEKGQGAAEYILLFGGIIVIVVIAVVYYKNYLSGSGEAIYKNDTQDISTKLQGLKSKFS